MNWLKIITFLNWIVIAVLGFLVIAETLSPAKGGDAAGRGMGLAIYYLAIIVLVVLIILNFLPFKWAKYTAFGIVAVPILLWGISPSWGKLKRNAKNLMEESKPIFEDKEREQLARAIRNGQPEKLSQLLQTPVARLDEGGELLGYAISEAAHSAYRPKEKLECVRLLFQASVKLDSAMGEKVPVHFAVAEAGNAALLRMLLEQGADANAMHINFKYPILFETLGSYQEPEASLRVLLEYGADPNSIALFDHETGPVSPLWRAAELERWSLCLILLEKGANPDFISSNGKTFRALIAESERMFPSEGYSAQKDYERLIQALK